MQDLSLVQFQHAALRAPLAGLYLAYGLEKAGIGFELKFYHQYTHKINLSKLYSFLAKTNKIIAIGCWSHTLPYVLVALERIKKNFPEKIIILGGIGPTEVAEDIMRCFPCVDFVIKGCGIESLAKLIKKLLNNDNDFCGITGLVYRDKDKIASNFYNRFFSSSIFNSIPSYHLLRDIKSMVSFTIQTSSGCPYRCAFCQFSSLSGRGLSFRDLKTVIEEIKLINKLVGKKKKIAFQIIDEAFITRRERVIEFCELLKSEKLDIKWGCYGRVDKMDTDLLKIISRSGCNSIFYGFDGGSDRILTEINKGFSREEAIKVILLSCKYIKGTIASFIYLYPFERPEDFLDTLACMAYLKSNKIKVLLNALVPVKGSLIYQKYKKSLFLCGPTASFFHEKITNMPKECIKLIRENPDTFYYYYTYNFKHLETLLKLSKSAGYITQQR